MIKIKNRMIGNILKVSTLLLVLYVGIGNVMAKKDLTVIDYEKFINTEIPQGTIKSLMINKVYYLFYWEINNQKEGVLVRRVMRKKYLPDIKFDILNTTTSWYQIPIDLSNMYKRKGEIYFEAVDDKVYVVAEDNRIERKVHWLTPKHDIASYAPL